MYKAVFPTLLLAAMAYYGWRGWDFRFNRWGASLRFWSPGLKQAIADFKAAAELRRSVEADVAQLDLDHENGVVSDAEYGPRLLTHLLRLNTKK